MTLYAWHFALDLHLATPLCPTSATCSKATPVSKHTQLVHKLQLMLMETPDQPSRYLMDICQ